MQRSRSIEKIARAAAVAKEHLATPLPILIIESITGHLLTVNIANGRLLVYSNDRRVFFDEPITKFRAVLFLNCKNCKMYILAKLLKITMIECINCHLEIHSTLVGPAELFHCIDSTVQIYAHIPLCTIESCKKVTVFQHIDELIYNVIACLESFVCVGETKHPIEDLLSLRRFYHIGSGYIEHCEQAYSLMEINLHPV